MLEPIYLPASSYQINSSQEDLSPLLEAIHSGDIDRFALELERFDLDQVYDHPIFPEPQRLSQFLLFRFLGLIDSPRPSNADQFIQIVLGKKPDLQFQVTPEWSFSDFIKERHECILQAISELSLLELILPELK